MKSITLENKWLVRSLFLVLLTYLVLRSIFVSPYIDEITTLFDYIEPDTLWDKSLTDGSANNHPLNSFLGKLMYFFFGDNFFFLRIPNILAFTLFFFSTKYIIQKSIVKEFQLTVFVSINTVAWVFEYFAYLRGYGLALGFFFSAIVLFHTWTENRKVYTFAFFLLFLWLAFFANLSFFNSIVVVLFYALIYIFMHFKRFSKIHIALYLCLFLFLFAAIYPLVQYSFELKTAGALWWGNLSGLWECTGVSLVGLTFSTNNEYFKYLFVFLFVSFAILGIISMFKKGFKSYLFSMEGLIFVLLFGNLLILEVLALFFKVNYPSDRAAMILVIFTIYTFCASIQHFKYVKNYTFLLLYFPFTFLLNLNVYSSVYQKNHRITPLIQEYLARHITSESSYSVDPLISQSMYYNLRKSETVNLFNKIEYGNSFIQPAYLVADTINYPTSIPSFYTLEMYDKNSELSIYKDSRKFNYIPIKDSLIKDIVSAEYFVGLINREIVFNGNKSEKFKVKISGEIHFKETPSPLNLTLTLGDSINRNKQYTDIELKKIARNKKSIQFNWNSPIYQSQEEMPELLMYFWNIEGKPIHYKNLHVTIYKAEEVK